MCDVVKVKVFVVHEDDCADILAVITVATRGLERSNRNYSNWIR